MASKKRHRFLWGLLGFIAFLILLILFIYIFYAFLWFDKKTNPINIWNSFFSDQALGWFKPNTRWEWGQSTYEKYATTLPDSGSLFGTSDKVRDWLYSSNIVGNNPSVKVGLFGFAIPLLIGLLFSIISAVITYFLLRFIIKLIAKSAKNKKQIKQKKEAKQQAQPNPWAQQAGPQFNYNKPDYASVTKEFYDASSNQTMSFPKYDPGQDWKALAQGANPADREREYNEYMAAKTRTMEYTKK
ncbi:MG319/MPN454 family protein [Mycoplasma sp. E35C]|uniref:MG319/MPN454 family protein n=1 Tax=Mycoplasma sp. E35C TaxID=2801918 RepID=UPI001CA3EAC6|nr:hypothetical protein [Mycoplasma sp. E35C]QZX49303.1 hypothetical protein JJE79_00905 [Mycoplasma sp. E35C]